MKKLLIVALIGLSLTSCKKDNEQQDKVQQELLNKRQRQSGYKMALEQVYYHALARKDYGMAEVVNEIGNRYYDEKAIVADIQAQKRK